MNGEYALLRAVRDQIRLHEESTGPTVYTFQDRQVDVEIDEMAPATVGDVYVIVTSAGFDEGPLNEGGGTLDLIFAVDVSVVLRSPKKPRDRHRELFEGFATYGNAVRDQVDFSYAVLDAANAYMLAEEEATGTCDYFLVPLRMVSGGPIRRAPAEIFAGVPGGGHAALIRTMHFRGARRPVKRN